MGRRSRGPTRDPPTVGLGGQQGLQHPGHPLGHRYPDRRALLGGRVLGRAFWKFHFEIGHLWQYRQPRRQRHNLKRQ